MSLLTWNSHWLSACKIGNGARSLSAMVNPVKSVQGCRHIISEFTSWISETLARIFLIVTLSSAAVSGLTAWCGPAQGAEKNSISQTPIPTSSLTYDESAKLAIRQSPFFTSSSVEIDIRRMDETDSRYGMVPPLTFRTYYYVNRPDNPGLNPKPYLLSFTMDPYNPFGSYFSLQAQKLATQMAILNHLGNISKGLERLGLYYLQLEHIKKMAAYQYALIKLDREILTYAENRLSIGTGTSLEAKVAQQELQLSQGELEQIELGGKRTLAELKKFLGLPPDAELNPVFQDSRRQVLGDFNPGATTLEQVKRNSYQIKAVEIRKKLQGYKILLAKASVLPNILFNTQTPDPLSATSGSGLYVGVGLEIPVWDGFKRFRNVSRQKAVLKQVDATKYETESSLEEEWYAGVNEVKTQDLALKIALSKEELARLKARQNEVRYQSGEVILPVSLESDKQVLVAQKEKLKKELQYNAAILKLRELSGDLGNTYVDPNSWQK